MDECPTISATMLDEASPRHKRRDRVAKIVKAGKWPA